MKQIKSAQGATEQTKQSGRGSTQALVGVGV